MTENTSQLIELKLKTIQYHSGDNLDYLQKNIARDACYTSHNSVAYKKKQIADACADFESAISEDRSMRAEALCTRIEKMQEELEHLDERHEADLAVYMIIHDGDEWTPERRQRKVSADLAKKVANIKKMVA